MKKTITAMAICLLLSAVCFAQKLSEDKVPAPVKAKFASLYAGVKGEKWELEDGNYEVEFMKGKTAMTIVIDPQGNLKETETKIEISELPKNALDYIAKKFPGAKIAEAAKMVDPAGKVRYEAEVNKKDILFDDKGNFIQ